MKDNIIQEKSFEFAIRIVNLYKFLCNDKKEFVLSKQVLRSGTSIGANIEEALGGFSDSDFVYKLQTAYKESRETIYWLKLLWKTDYLKEKQAKSIIKDATDLCKIISKILLTTKEKLIIKN